MSVKKVPDFRVEKVRIPDIRFRSETIFLVVLPLRTPERHSEQ